MLKGSGFDLMDNRCIVTACYSTENTRHRYKKVSAALSIQEEDFIRSAECFYTSSVVLKLKWCSFIEQSS